MRSSARSEGFDLARDLYTTAEDNVALRRAKAVCPLDLEGYLRFLRQLPPRTPDELRAKQGPRAERPFTMG